MEKVSSGSPLESVPANSGFLNHLYYTVVPDGYGLSYSIGDDYIRWTITSLKRQTGVLKHYLAEAATEVKHMLESAQRKDGEKVDLSGGKAKL